MNGNKSPLAWMFWHPHQGLWNWTLVNGIRTTVRVGLIYKALVLPIILIDSFILGLRAVAMRVSAVGLSRIVGNAKVPADMSVLYLDAGTHKEAAELTFVTTRVLPKICGNVEAYGFEASKESFDRAAAKFAGTSNIHIIHGALAYDLPVDRKLRLYKDQTGGIGDSLYRETPDFEEVDAMRLSDFLNERRLIKDNQIVLLRMNIEGAEYDVLKDLVQSGLAQRIDGYFGMWDDVSKIDVARDQGFRAFTAQNHIHTFTFNERDLRWAIRRKIIAYAMRTRIMQGCARARKRVKQAP